MHAPTTQAEALQDTLWPVHPDTLCDMGLAGYPLAIVSTSIAIIQTMANRCTATNGDSSTLCGFNVPYNSSATASS